MTKASQWARALKPFVRDFMDEIISAVERGDHILLEGAQGTLLDLDLGTYPYVTSSSTVAGGAAVGSGVGPTRIGEVIGITKAYTTRVGEGPFPTELKSELGQWIRTQGDEFGATTGRPRRCGWLDAVALKTGIQWNGCTGLAVMKLDVLSGLEEIQACVGYQAPGIREPLKTFPSDPNLLSRCEPVYKSFTGWKESLRGCREFSELPASAQRFLTFIEEFSGCPLVCVSVGPGRSETIVRRQPFART
jgi:adenylosuccinate synthase